MSGPRPAPPTDRAPAPDGAPAVRVEGLSKRFGRRVALDGVSFAASPGEMVAVIGPNGAGKTTLLSILAGAQAPSEGTVQAPAGAARHQGTGHKGAGHKGAGHKGAGHKGIAGGARHEIGWVPQEPAVYSKLSVAENLRLFARLEKVADPQETVRRMLEQTGLAARAEDRVASLSGGNRQRVNVALGLLSDPPVVLLDEPSTALDPAQRERLWRFISTLAANGACVIFSTHIVSEAARYAQRVLVLDEGRLSFDGTAQELMKLAGTGPDEGFEGAFVAFLERAGGEGGRP